MAQRYETPFWELLKDLCWAFAEVGAQRIGLSWMCSGLQSQRHSQRLQPGQFISVIYPPNEHYIHHLWHYPKKEYTLL